MRIRLMHGARRGEVVDMLPHEARAMLADGRASLPESLPEAPPAPAVVVERVEARQDRVHPRAKSRTTR